MPTESFTRRAFTGAVTAASYSRVLGANERIQLGFIGYGLIGVQHVHDFGKQPDAELECRSFDIGIASPIRNRKREEVPGLCARAPGSGRLTQRSFPGGIMSGERLLWAITIRRPHSKS